MSQLKNSESAKLNAIKRELSITLRVLERELSIFNECMDSTTNKNNENTLSSLYMRNSINEVVKYLKDLREDCNDEISQEQQKYIEGQRNLSDWIYEHYNNNELYNRVYDETLEYINDRLDYTKFNNINFDEFKFIQIILFNIKHKGILWEDQIEYLVNNGFIEFPGEEE